jgi:hypothetical protein
MQAERNFVLYDGSTIKKNCSLGLRFHTELQQKFPSSVTCEDLEKSWEMSRCDFKYVHQLKFHVTALALPMVGYLKIYNLFIQWNSFLMQI